MTSWPDPTTFAKTWELAVATRPGETFLIFERPGRLVGSSEIPAYREWTYAEFDKELERAATLLAGHGVLAGSAVHLALTNSPTFVAVWLAAIRMGAWIVPSDPMGRAPELADHLARTRPVIGFCARQRSEVYRQAVETATESPDGVTEEFSVIEVDEADVDLMPFPSDVRYHDWHESKLTDRAAVMFTSGTTGKPKGVEITQANYAFAGCAMADAAGLTSEDRHLVVLPLFHANAQYYSFASAIWAGASVALMPTFSASGFLPQAAKYAATVASVFAAPLRMILARGGAIDGGRPDPDSLVLRHCWFAQNITEGQYEQVSEWFGCAPRQLYGMTETIPAVLTDRATSTTPSSIGSLTPMCEVQIHDAAGQPVDAGEHGSIVVRGERGITLFAGYLDDPETTAKNFAGEWFLTGDHGSQDAEGRFYFEGRRSDVLKVSGENVSTLEVESVLSQHPGVSEAAVIGAPDPVRDEVPVAFVVAVDLMHPPTAEELHEWCGANLGPAKRPRRISFLDSLPRTSVGKIRTYALKQHSEFGQGSDLGQSSDSQQGSTAKQRSAGNKGSEAQA